MTITFKPVLGIETAAWRSTGAVVNGPIDNPDALPSLPLYLIFWGSSWTTALGQTYATDAQAILNSRYLSGLVQYGAGGTLTWGGHVVDTRACTGQPGRDAEIDYAISTLATTWKKSTALVPTSGSTSGNAGYCAAPIYAVIDDVNTGGAMNGGGVNTRGGVGYLTNAINYQGPVTRDDFTTLLAHELVERISDGTGNGVGFNTAQAAGGRGNDQVADNEPDGERYTYRLGGTVRVQAYWSVVDQKYLIPDGTQHTVTLAPLWTSQGFTRRYDLLAVEVTPSAAAPSTAPMNAALTRLSLGRDRYFFEANEIRNVTVYSLRIALQSDVFHGTVYRVTGSSASWAAITGGNTHASQLVTDGADVYMLARNDAGSDMVWKYNGTGTDWTALTGSNTTVGGIAASGGKLYMVAHNGDASRAWRYDGTGTAWTPITESGKKADRVVASASGLFMLGEEGGRLRLWQYSGAGTAWRLAIGDITTAYEVVSTGADVYFEGHNGSEGNRVWRYAGPGTRWEPITGTNTTVGQIAAWGDRLYLLGNNGDGNRVWEYDGAGTSWTPVTGTNTAMKQISTMGGVLWMVANNGAGDQRWMYRGVGTEWAPF